MGSEKYIGFEKVIKDALVDLRGKRVMSSMETIIELEKKLETAKLSLPEASEIRKQIKQLRERKR